MNETFLARYSFLTAFWVCTYGIALYRPLVNDLKNCIPRTVGRAYFHAYIATVPRWRIQVGDTSPGTLFILST